MIINVFKFHHFFIESFVENDELELRVSLSPIFSSVVLIQLAFSESNTESANAMFKFNRKKIVIMRIIKLSSASKFYLSGNLVILILSSIEEMSKLRFNQHEADSEIILPSIIVSVSTLIKSLNIVTSEF